MSVNFGYGGYGSYGMMNGAGFLGNNTNFGGGTFQSINAQYSCPTCYQHGPIPYNYKTFVNPLPQYAVKPPSWFTRIFGRIFG